jgi:hypothetical protein
MPYFVCSLPNPGTKGPHRQFISDDPAAIQEWARAEDRPGLSVYYCPNPLIPGANRRALETIAEITCLHVDLDFKDIEEDVDTIDQRLRQLPEPPTEVRDSGGGRHVFWQLREPIGRNDPDFEPTKALLRRLTQCLCGDPAPAHIAALLRQPGTHNTKRGSPVLCQTLWNGGGPVDPDDIVAMLDLLQDAPLLTRKGSGTSYTNGHGGGWRAPVDVEARLARMKWQGEGGTSINITQRDCSAKMLREGCSVEVQALPVRRHSVVQGLRSRHPPAAPVPVRHALSTTDSERHHRVRRHRQDNAGHCRCCCHGNRPQPHWRTAEGTMPGLAAQRRRRR